MLTSTTYLAVHRPSPTSILFTVSNASLPTTVVTRALSYLTIVCRVLLFLSVLATLTIKLLCDDLTVACSSWLSWLPKPIKSVVVTTRWEILVPIATALIFLSFRRFHTEESLLVLRSLGIQTSTSSSTYLSTSTTRFIPTSEIQDIFIHEAFRGLEVRYYLAVVVKDEKEVTVVFSTLLPSLNIVEQVWRGARQCLFELNSKD